MICNTHILGSEFANYYCRVVQVLLVRVEYKILKKNGNVTTTVSMNNT